jgi:hypothetical protein
MNDFKEGEERKTERLYAIENAGAGTDTCSFCGGNTEGKECGCNRDTPMTVSMDRTAKPSEAEFFLQT